MQVALESGVKVETGLKVVSVDVEKTAIKLESGNSVSADIIIGADGVHVSSDVPFHSVVLLPLQTNS